MSSGDAQVTHGATAALEGARPLDRSDKRPLWQQLLADLERRLADGEFDQSFPGELAIGGEYQVSRHTVREALRRLRATGAVTAARGRMPTVVKTEIEQPIGALYSLFASVESSGVDQVSVVRRLDIRADGVVADRLALDGSTPLLYLERLRLAAGEPLAIDRVWLPASLASPLLEADFTRDALYTEMAERCGIRLIGGSEQIRAVMPTDAERRLLGVNAGSAAFAIARLGMTDRAPVEWRHTLVRGDRFSMSVGFSGQGHYPVGFTALS